MHAPRKPVIGVMGAGEGATAADRRLAEELGGGDRAPGLGVA